MLHKDLAAALGISGAMVSRLAKRGMPVDSLERAERWRARHLEPARTKAWRMGAASPPPAAPIASFASIAATTLHQVYDLAAIGAELLPLGRFHLLEPHLRAALRGLPPHARDALMIAMPAEADAGSCADACTTDAVPLAVWDALLADVEAAMRDEAQADDDAPRSDLTDAEAAQMARFWFQVGAGEWRAVKA